jgi:hypothetical protein
MIICNKKWGSIKGIGVKYSPIVSDAELLDRSVVYSRYIIMCVFMPMSRELKKSSSQHSRNNPENSNLRSHLGFLSLSGKITFSNLLSALHHVNAG